MRIIPVLFFLGLLFSQASSWAQKTAPSARIQGIALQADNMDRDSVNETVDLVGGVQIIFQNQHLSCDRARINLRAKTIDAVGNVTVTTPLATISGGRVVLDYESNTGLILDGFVQSGNVLFEGAQIHKISDTDYIADDAHYTTCTTCPEAWNFSGGRIRAEIGGYAYIKNSVLRFGSVPVLWLPYLAVPLKTDRQSGLLTPGLENSDSGGTMISQSYFWAMSRNQDSTMTAQYFDKRGLKGLLNYRYVLNENSRGNLDVGYLFNDKVFSGTDRFREFRTDSSKDSALERWFTRYDHYYEMPEGFVHRAQINNASDLQYPKDFPLETLNHGDPAMETRMSLTKNTTDQHYSADMSLYKNLLQSDPRAGTDNAVNRLPELRFSQVQSKLGNSDFLYSVDLDYVNFARSGFAYDDLNAAYVAGATNNRHINASGPAGVDCTTGDWEKNHLCHPSNNGSFEDGVDLVRTGQRLDFKPSIYRPMKFSNLDLLPSMSFRETDYTFPVGPDANVSRRYLRGEISARTTFSKIYGDFSALQTERIKHEIQPEITYTTIPWFEQKKSYFFSNTPQEEITFFNQQNSVSDADLNGSANIQFDYNDRVYDRELFTFGITNKFTRKSWQNGAPIYLQFINWKLAQSYDVYQSKRNSNQALSSLLSELKVTVDRFQIYQKADYYPLQGVTDTSTRFRVTNQGDYVQIEHLLKYTDITPGNESVSDAARTEAYTATLKKAMGWLDLLGKATYDVNPESTPEADNNRDYRFKSWGYGAQLKLPGDCIFFSVTQYHVTGGDTNFKASLAFIWDGKSQPPISDNILGTFGF